MYNFLKQKLVYSHLEILKTHPNEDWAPAEYANNKQCIYGT